MKTMYGHTSQAMGRRMEPYLGAELGPTTGMVINNTGEGDGGDGESVPLDLTSVGVEWSFRNRFKNRFVCSIPLVYSVSSQLTSTFSGGSPM